MGDLTLNRQPRLQPGNEGDVGLAVSQVTAPKPVLPTWQWQQPASGRAKPSFLIIPC